MQQPIQILIILTLSLNMNAQISTGKITGEYYLRGVMETASGLKLNEDSSFEFFFSQGALDRFGKGTWKLVDGKIVLNSRPKPPVDFALLESKHEPGNFIQIKLTGVNEYLLHFLEAKIKTSKGEEYGQTDSHGVMRIPAADVEEITLHFLICGERVSVFRPADKKHNYFEFKPEPWVDEVFCENLTLRIEEAELVGAHPLLQGNAYHYEKAR
jgi:hypothetical protein